MRVVLFLGLLSFAFQSWAELPVIPLKISLTLGQKNAQVLIPQSGDNRLELSTEALRAVDPLSLVSLQSFPSSEPNTLAVQASAAYSAPSFAPVLVKGQIISNSTQQALAEVTIEVEVQAVLQIRLTAGDVFDAPTKISLQPHAGGVLVRFINDDEGNVEHRIHGEDAIEHSPIGVSMKTRGETYETRVESTELVEGMYMCHLHGDYNAANHVQFNVTDEAVLKDALYSK